MLIKVDEMIRESWKTYRKHFRSITTYLLFSFLLSTLLSLLLLLPLLFRSLESSFLAQSFPWIIGTPLFFIVFYLFFQMMIGFELHLRHSLHNEKPKEIKDTIKDAKPFVFTSMGVSFLTGIFTGLPLLIGLIGLFGKKIFTFFTSSVNFETINASSSVLPSIQISGVGGYFFALLTLYGCFHIFYFSTLLSMSFNAVIFDKKSVRESLEMSLGLIQGRWWQVWWRLFAPEGLLIGIYMIISIFTFILRMQLGNTAGTIGEIFLGFFINFFAAIPIIYLPNILLYEDLKKKPIK